MISPISPLFPLSVSAVFHRWDNQQASGLLRGRSHAGCGPGPYLWQQNRVVGRPGKWSEKFPCTTWKPLRPTPILHIQQWPLLWISARNCTGAWGHPQPTCVQVKQHVFVMQQRALRGVFVTCSYHPEASRAGLIIILKDSSCLKALLLDQVYPNNAIFKQIYFCNLNPVQFFSIVYFLSRIYGFALMNSSIFFSPFTTKLLYCLLDILLLAALIQILPFSTLQAHCQAAGQVPRHPCPQWLGAPVWHVAEDGQVLCSHPQVLQGPWAECQVRPCSRLRLLRSARPSMWLIDRQTIDTLIKVWKP